MAIEFRQQLEISGIITQLLDAKQETFDPAVAIRLREIVQDADLASAPTKTVTTIRRSNPFSKIIGFAAGIGNVETDSNQKEVTAKTHGVDSIVAGNWIVSQRALLVRNNNGTAEEARAISIHMDRKFDQTRLGEDRESYAMFYHSSGEPKYLSKAEFKAVANIRLFGIRYYRLAIDFNNVFKRPTPQEPQP